MVYEAASWSKAGARAEEVMEQIQRWEKLGFNFLAKVADTGGGGRMYVEDVMSRYSQVFEAAKKTEKVEHVRLMNDELLSGRIKGSSGRGVFDGDGVAAQGPGLGSLQRQAPVVKIPASPTTSAMPGSTHFGACWRMDFQQEEVPETIEERTEKKMKNDSPEAAKNESGGRTNTIQSIRRSLT